MGFYYTTLFGGDIDNVTRDAYYIGRVIGRSGFLALDIASSIRGFAGVDL